MSACKAALNVKGAQYCCDMEAPHPGWAHGNTEAGAIWCSDGEAKRWDGKAPPGAQRMSTNPQQVLAAPLTHTDLPHVATVGDYLRHLLQTLWKETYRFDGKRPFGNSGWENDLYMALVHAGLVEGSLDEDGFLDSVDDKAAHNLIKGAINYVFA